jgi:YVTN family beta-propeller protein
MNKIMIICAFLFCSVLHAQTASEYKIVNRIHLDGDGGWDYVSADNSTDRLFVSHSTMMQVVDLHTGKLLATIPGTHGVHGIALATDLNKGFISCGKVDSVLVIDLTTFEVLAEIAVTGRNPDAILYDIFSGMVFSFNHEGNNTSVIDAHSNKIIATIALDGQPEFAVTDGKGNVYVNIEDKNSICVINSKTLKVEKTWSIAPGEEPTGLAMDVDRNILFTVCHNQRMMILDAQNGNIITSLPIGQRVDGAAFDPVTKRAYSSNGDVTLTVIQEEDNNSFHVMDNIATAKGARTLDIHTKSHHLFLPTADFEVNTGESQKRVIKRNSFVILEVAPMK